MLTGKIDEIVPCTSAPGPAVDPPDPSEDPSAHPSVPCPRSEVGGQAEETSSQEKTTGEFTMGTVVASIPRMLFPDWSPQHCQ